MSNSILREKSKQFAIDIISVCREMRKNKIEYSLVDQLLRSVTSIGANIHEANYAASRADFINKMQIALKECYESDYWIELLRDTKNITEPEYKKLYTNCSKIRRLLTASITTAKANGKGTDK